MLKRDALHPDTPKPTSPPAAALKCPPANQWATRDEKKSLLAPMSPSDWMRYRDSRLRQFGIR